MMQVASIQMGVIEEDKSRAIDQAVHLMQQCRGADLIVLPELWNIGFMSFDHYYSQAEPENGPTLSAMQTMARELAAHVHTGSFVLQEGESYFNASYLLSPTGDILGSYRKIHLFAFNSQENQLLTPGNEISVVQTPLAAFGLATCFDLRFPELFRKMVDQGAEVFLVCSAWPYPRLEHWLIFNRARAVENQCALISANSVGPNRGATLVGHSMIVDSWGTVLASGGDEEAILKSEVDVQKVHQARQRFPGLAGRTDWI
ncbi:MAG: carbon-nitrogen family hydrolase [Desulfovermiculus sp.]|nr:carbon-nitrogen family hydrolase [Desulfovermiculus sp.]